MNALAGTSVLAGAFFLRSTLEASFSRTERPTATGESNNFVQSTGRVENRALKWGERMTRAIVMSLLATHLSLVGSSGQAGTISPTNDCDVSRDAYAGVLFLEGIYLSNFRLDGTGLELVKFGSPPQALTNVRQPTSVADLSGFTVTDPLDHRLVFLSFKNLTTGGLFSAHGEISVLTITPHPASPLFELHYEATLSSGFGGLPVTTITGSYVYDALSRPTFSSTYCGGREAQYAILSSSATVGGTSWTTTGGFISVQDNLSSCCSIPEPTTLILAAIGIAGIAGARLGHRPR